MFIRYKMAENDHNEKMSIVSESITEYRNKIGELYAERAINIADINQLKAGNAELYSEIQNLKDHPVVITNVVTETVIDPITIHDTVSVDSEGIYSFPISYSDSWCRIKGKSLFDLHTMIGEVTMDTIAFVDSLWVDLIEHKGQLSFIARSSNPYVRINNLNGAVLSPEQSRAFAKRFERKWVLSVGIGGTLTWYDNRFLIVPGVQLTFGRKLLSF